MNENNATFYADIDTVVDILYNDYCKECYGYGVELDTVSFVRYLLKYEILNEMALVNRLKDLTLGMLQNIKENGLTLKGETNENN